MSSGVGLAALVVNYNSGAFAVRCVESLIDEWEREGRDRARLHVVVVDNASPEDQEPWLGRLAELGAEVVRHGENAGYAGGINLAYARTRGGPDDVVAILNPDLYFLPGSVGTLVDYLGEHPECGAVDPRACIDPLGVLNLPRNLLPTITDHLRILLGTLSPRMCRGYSRHRLEHALPWWSAEGPVVADMLSGCCVFLRRGVVDRLDHLLDPRYPLYYEDTDLFRELRRRGLELVHHGAARVLHHWSRSSGVGGQFQGEPLRRYRISQRAYFTKFYGPLGYLLVRGLNALERAWPQDKLYRPMHSLTPLGAFSDPVVIPVGRPCRFLIELGMAPTWIVACGIFGEGDEWVCPAETWEWFFQAEYFMRAIDLDTGDFLGAWQFTKTSPGRDTPIERAEIEALGIGADGVPAPGGAAPRPSEKERAR